MNIKLSILLLLACLAMATPSHSQSYRRKAKPHKTQTRVVRSQKPLSQPIINMAQPEARIPQEASLKAKMPKQKKVVIVPAPPPPPGNAPVPSRNP